MPRNHYLDSEGIALLWRTFKGHVKAINDIKSNSALKADVEVLRKIVAPTETELQGATSVSAIPSSLGAFGTIYKITADYTTTATFVEGAGYNRPANTYIVVVHDPTNFDNKKLTCVIDLSIYGDKTDYNDASDAYDEAYDTVHGVENDPNHPGFINKNRIEDESVSLSNINNLLSDDKIPTVREVVSIITSFINTLNTKLDKNAISSSYTTASNTTVYNSNVISTKVNEIKGVLDAAADTAYMTANNFATLSDITAIFKYKGSITPVLDNNMYVIPTISNPTVGDVYTTTSNFFLDSRFREYDANDVKQYPKFTNIVISNVNGSTITLDIFVGPAVFETLDESDINAAISSAEASGPIFRYNTTSPAYTVTLSINAGSAITGYQAIALQGSVWINNTCIYSSDNEPTKCTFIIQCSSTDKIGVVGSNTLVKGFVSSSHTISSETEKVDDAADLYNRIVFNPWETNTYSVNFYKRNS